MMTWIIMHGSNLARHDETMPDTDTAKVWFYGNTDVTSFASTLWVR